MAAAKFVAFTMLCFCVCANAHTHTLAIHPSHAEGLNSRTTHSLNHELTRLLSPAGIDLEWQADARSRAVVGQPGRLIVATFEGTCSVDAIPNNRVTSSYAGRTLAETSISDGRILPYFTVDCSHVIRTLAPVLQPLGLPMREAVFGRALARVVAHEIYHILAETTEHEEAGLAKAQLTFRDLTAERFDLSPASLQRIRAAYRATSPGVPVAGLVSRELRDH